MGIPILAVSDETDPRIHSSTVRERLGHVRMVLGCGDLPTDYLEFLADALNRPVYYVLGNHAEELRRGAMRGDERKPMGATDLGGRVVRDPDTGLILAGVPGSPKYGNHEPAQYTDWEIRIMLAKMVPRLMWNRLRHGRALDVLVTHAPPRGIGDREDVAHRGYVPLVGFVRWAKPSIHLHGHIHLYDRNECREFRLDGTRIINVFPYQVLELDDPPAEVRR